MQSPLETDLVKQAKVRNAISELREEHIFESGAWIKIILDLIKTHVDPDKLAQALILLNRFYPEKLSRSTNADEELRSLFIQLSVPENTPKLLNFILSYIILNEQKKIKSSRDSVLESRYRQEFVVALRWILLSMESLQGFLPSKMLIDCIISLQQLPKHKHPLLVFASYLILTRLKQPSFRIMLHSQDTVIEPYRLYYTIENDKLIYLQFDDDGKKRLKHIFSGEVFLPEDTPLRFIEELKQHHHVTESCNFDSNEILQSMLTCEFPFIYSIFLEKCFSLPFWVDSQFQPMIPKILEYAKEWIKDSELLHYIFTKLPHKHHLTPEFFQQMISLTERGIVSGVDTRELVIQRICDWIKASFIDAEHPASDSSKEGAPIAAEEKYVDSMFSVILQRNIFFKIYPAEGLETTLSFMQDIKKATFFECPNLCS